KDFSIPARINKEDQEILERYNEYPFTIAIFKKLHDKLHVIFSNEDVLFLATQILCSKFIGVDNSDDVISNISKYDQKILDFIDEMLLNLGHILEVDLTKDKKLRESLIFHLRPTIFRLRYGSPQSNSLVNFIKNEYKNVFRAAWSISIMFEKYFGLQITEDELGYIVLYIQSSLERRDHNYKAVLLAESNLGHAQLLSERIHKMVPEIGKLDVISHHDFKLYEHIEADIIITSTPLIEKDKRIVVIPNLLSEGGIRTLRNFMDHLNLRKSEDKNPFAPICFQLFSPELIFMHQSFASKDEVLQYMCERMESKGYVTARFYDSVMEREKATTTSIGNQVALPHGAMGEVNENHVAIAILNEPILWDDDEKVDVIFLLGFKMGTHEEIKRIQTFYKQYIALIETDEKVKIIRSKTSNIELYRYLIQ
ncbi:MAG: PTS sugar transporter subunit IIA, partial [Longicatena sp.]